MKLSGWGRFPELEAQIYSPRSEAELAERIKAGSLIARGNGRSYGDSAISHQNTVHMRHFNRLIGFDADTGQLEAEAGVLLADVIHTFLPRGWFPAVTPGTKFVTLGGMIAADVHGKNHHIDGSFGAFVDWIDVLVSSGTVLRCSRQENADLFAWTVGGMGLTGVILRAAFRLRSVDTAWIKQTTLPAANLDAAITLFEQSLEVPYSVAWIDCLSKGNKLGRSLVMLGEHATRDDLTESQRSNAFKCDSNRQTSVPFNLPSSLLNSITIGGFNAFYHWNGTRNSGRRLVDWDSYFYPLDSILDWNKIYGRRGLAQFQCVLPLEQSRQGLQALTEEIARSRSEPFLAVLKRLGSQREGLSFPMPGFTLALDFPVNERTLTLMTVLDQITLAYGGRFYLAKDSRMSAETLHSSDSRVEHFVQMRAKGALRRVFASAQSERLGL